MATKKRNPTGAAKKRTDTLEDRVELLEELVASLCEGYLQLVSLAMKKKKAVK